MSPMIVVSNVVKVLDPLIDKGVLTRLRLRRTELCTAASGEKFSILVGILSIKVGKCRSNIFSSSRLQCCP
jgi:hypothetical protein